MRLRVIVDLWIRVGGIKVGSARGILIVVIRLIGEGGAQRSFTRNVFVMGAG